MKSCIRKNSLTKNKYFLTALFIADILLVYFTWCLQTIEYRGSLYGFLSVIGAITVTVCVVITAIICKKQNIKTSILWQFRVINELALAGALAVTISDILSNRIGFYIVLADIAIFVMFLILYKVLKCDIRKDLISLWQFVKREWKLFFIMAISGCLGFLPYMNQFKWDGALYRQILDDMNIHSLSSMGAFGHLSQGYAFLECIIKAFIINSDAAITVLNLLLYLSSIPAFYGITESLIGESNSRTRLLAVMVYAFSPFTLGMAGYYSLDYATLCLFVIWLCFWIKGMWVFHFAAALLFCITKEPAIVTYGAFCLGVLICDFLRRKPKDIFCDVRYYFMALIGILWIITFMLLGGWSGGESSVGISVSYAAEKLKVLYVLNFNWIFAVIGVIAVWQIKKKKIYDDLKNATFYGLICAAVFFTLFSIIFQTVNHARYAANMPALLYIIAIYAIGSLLLNEQIKIKVINTGLVLMAILMLFSSFKTIDPISLACFQKVDTGAGRMITTGSPVMGDSMIYNKEMLYMEDALNKALADAIAENRKIYIPTYNDSSYAFDGMMIDGEINDNIRITTQFWDEAKKKRTAYENENTREFDLNQILNETDLSSLKSGSEYNGLCYIYSDVLGKEQADKLEKIYDITDRREYECGGWKIGMICF